MSPGQAQTYCLSWKLCFQSQLGALTNVLLFWLVNAWEILQYGNYHTNVCTLYYNMSHDIQKGKIFRFEQKKNNWSINLSQIKTIQILEKITKMSRCDSNAIPTSSSLPNISRNFASVSQFLPWLRTVINFLYRQTSLGTVISSRLLFHPQLLRPRWTTINRHLPGLNHCALRCTASTFKNRRSDPSSLQNLQGKTFSINKSASSH